MVSILGLDHADVLRVLYNSSRPQGLGFLHYDPNPMSKEEARQLLTQTRYFDYLKGRVMKIKIPIDATEIDERLYDRDLGPGACERAIATLR